MSQPQPNASAQSGGPAGPAFPCQDFPDEPRNARLLGIYPQRPPGGRFMQRVRIPGGILSAGQWRALAAITRRFTPATPLHLTTRQDIELHDLSEEHVPHVQQSLAEAGLTSLGSGGDSLRNVVVCPCAAGGTNEAPNLLPLEQAITRALAACEGIFALPRKFKVSLGCEGGCGRPFIHDLAFVAVKRGGQWGVKVIGAGSLGPKPGSKASLETTPPSWTWDGASSGSPVGLAESPCAVASRSRDNSIRGSKASNSTRKAMADSPCVPSMAARTYQQLSSIERRAL